MFGEVQALIKELWPDTELYDLANATHGLQMQNPRDAAAALASFLGRHPLQASTPSRLNAEVQKRQSRQGPGAPAHRHRPRLHRAPTGGIPLDSPQ
jgi:hypothetical protein